MLRYNSNASTYFSSPTELLGAFSVPGFSFLCQLLLTHLYGESSPWTLVMLLAVFAAFYSRNLVENWFTSTVEIQWTDPVYEAIQFWLARPEVSKMSTRLRATTGSRMFWTKAGAYLDEEHVLQSDPPRPVSMPRMVFTLGNGKHCFWYGWNLVVVVREETELVDSLLLSCFGRNNECLQEIVHEAQLEFAELGDNMTPVYRTQVNRDSSATWARAPSQRRRLLATVIMNADWQEKFMDDMIAYLRPETQAWHDERGLPCRRGYLFVGPPGTGKTSLCIAAASRFRLPIYVLSLNNITEGDLNHLISNLASRCILLLEDIDTQRFAYTRTPDSDGISTQPPLTLSALLNALDGVIATDGRIVILTTNHRDKLDPALIRPGRVDLEIPFEHPDVDSIARLFLLVYSRHASSDRHAAIPHCPRCPDFPSSPPATDPAAIPETELKALARQFAMSLPEKKYSQARLLTFLKTYPGQPKKAMEIAAEQFKEDVVEPTPVCEQPQKSRKKRSFFK